MIECPIEKLSIVESSMMILTLLIVLTPSFERKDTQSPKKMGNRGTRFLRKVCECEEGLTQIPRVIVAKESI